ncbi:MDR family MFS transporter [Cohnella cholangitidis]|uniref:MFS transporter n=1 Tax=Cohnella cholangitidis TaxID=2598458 RepID=A0A7G5BUV6_9BACL|nr:MFS transporter [Cohnella cholangitidis]QMV40740.1 MFS transporter [Cohnella cholangitidis]
MVKFANNIIGRYDSGIWIRVLGAALTTITGFMIRPFLVLYLYDQLEGSVILPMIIVGLQPLCGLFVSWFGGSWSDRYGRKPLILIALALQMLCMIGYVFAEDVWQYALISIINGIGFALYGPAASAQITDIITEEKRAEVFALMHTAFNVGAAVGPVLGLLMFGWNPSAVFLMSAMSFVLYGLLVWFKIPESAPLALKGPTANSTPLPQPAKPKFSWAEHKGLVLMTMLCLPVGLLYAQVESTLPLHLQTNFEHYRTVLASLLTFNGIMVIALQIWIARRTEPVPSHLIIGISYALFAVVSLGYGYSGVVVWLFAAEFIFTIGEMMFGPHMQKAVSVMAPQDQRGFYFSVYGTSQLLSRGLGPILGGLLLEWSGGETLFTVLAALMVVAGYAQFKVIKRLT